MRINNWLWLLWAAMIISMLLKWRMDTYMAVAVIILPVLIVLLDLQEEVNNLKEEAKHQRKFVMDRYQALTEKMTDLSTNMEKKLVVDFAEFARANPTAQSAHPSRISANGLLRRKKKKKRPLPEGETGLPTVDLAADHPPAASVTPGLVPSAVPSVPSLEPVGPSLDTTGTMPPANDRRIT